MKKSLKILLLLVFLFPIVTFADIAPVFINSYAVQATKGSEIVIEVRGFQDMDGTLKYNKDELKYVSIRVENPTVLEGEVHTGSLKIVKNTPGEFSFKHQPAVVDGMLTEAGVESVLVKFEVLKVPTSKTINVTYYPNNTDVLYGQKAYTIKVPVRLADDKVTTTNDTNLGAWVENPKPYEPETPVDSAEDQEDGSEQTADGQEIKNECPECNCTCPDVKEQDNTLMYVSWAVSAVLLMALIAVLSKNKKNKE